LQQSFQNKPAYFKYHPVGLIVAVILDVPVDVMSVQSIYAIEEDKQLADFLFPRF
jgi:stage III sporulation protein SpoIIIAA